MNSSSPFSYTADHVPPSSHLREPATHKSRTSQSFLDNVECYMLIFYFMKTGGSKKVVIVLHSVVIPVNLVSLFLLFISKSNQIYKIKVHQLTHFSCYRLAGRYSDVGYELGR